MNARASVDLRVNTLRAARDDMLVGLRSLEVAAERTPFSSCRPPHRVRRRARRPAAHAVLPDRRVRVPGRSLAARHSALRGEAGQSVLDLAAGAGGKSLALAALMRNRGEILAFDIDARRLKQLPPRARRAGASIIRIADRRGGPAWGKGKFDVVLVDAPCSGSGTWRRNPELKWRLTPERLHELIGLQSWLIDDGARHTKPGGRLVYVTCSLLASRERGCVQGFPRAKPGFSDRSRRQSLERSGAFRASATRGWGIFPGQSLSDGDGRFFCLYHRTDRIG